MAEAMNGKSGDDPFSNFLFQPPKQVGKYRPYARRCRFRAMQGMRLSQPRNSITGSNQDLLDPAKLMSLQEDAKSRRISSEIMKHRLYESVVAPAGKRRSGSNMHRSYIDGTYYKPTEDIHSDEVTRLYMHPTRMAMSVPVTPATSSRTTPCGSPTQNRSFLFSMFPRHPEEDVDPETPDGTKGLASIFSPQPKYVPAARWTPRVQQEQQEQGKNDAEEWATEATPIRLQQVPRSRVKAGQGQKERSPSPMDDSQP